MKVYVVLIQADEPSDTIDSIYTSEEEAHKHKEFIQVNNPPFEIPYIESYELQ